MRCKLIALASFHNPEFSKKQRMKYSVYGEPRIISRALNGDQFLQVPRGCLESTLQVLKGERLNPIVEDKRYAGVPIDVEFKGTLRIDQKPAVADLKKSSMSAMLLRRRHLRRRLIPLRLSMCWGFRRPWSVKMDGIRSS